MSRSKRAGISKPNTSTRILYVNFCQNNTQNEYYKCIIHSILFSQVPGRFYQTSWHQEETASVWGTIIRVGCNYVASAHQSQDCKGSIESNCLFFRSCVFTSILLICRSVGHHVITGQQIWKIWNNHDTCHSRTHLPLSALSPNLLYLSGAKRPVLTCASRFWLLLRQCLSAHLHRPYRFYSILMWTVHCWASWDCSVQAASKLPLPLRPCTNLTPWPLAGPQRSASRSRLSGSQRRGPFYPCDRYMVVWRAEGPTERHKPARDAQRMEMKMEMLNWQFERRL